MQFDDMTKEKLLAMDNRSLAELIGRISADQRKTGALLSDLDGLKKQFAKLSPADAEKLLSLAGKEKSEQILRMLQEQ